MQKDRWVLQEIPLPYNPGLVALDTDSNRAVVTAAEETFSWWQNIVMIVDLNIGTVLNTITPTRGIKGIAVDTGKDIGVTSGLKEINLFDISSASLLSDIKDGDSFLNGIKLKGCFDSWEDDDIINDDDLNTDITNFLNLYSNEIDEAIINDLTSAGDGLASFQNDFTFGVDINGIQASIINNTFSATVPLEEGENIITAIATDQYNRTGTSIITVTLTTKGSIAGTVTSALTGLGISSATVTVIDSLNNTNTAVTDSYGEYSFVGIEQGTFSMTIASTGYNQYTYIGTLSVGETLTVNAALTAIPPIISSTAVTNITSDSAAITWTTDQQSNSLVEYGQTTAYGSLASDSTLTTAHTIILTGLTPSATYHNRITSTAANGASATSSDFTFQTEGQETIAITITAPTDGSTIDGSEVIVKGYLTNTTGNETGVNVNGVVPH